ncbi:MAG: hypothetical protein RL226_356, partial [Bacteroidota bacterium]
MKWLLPAVFLLTQTICHSQIREGFRLVNPLSSSAQALNKVKNGQPGIFPLAILLDSLEVQSTADSV